VVGRVLTELGVVRAEEDRLQGEVRSAVVVQTPELMNYDLDGNLVRDGRWLYSWDAENRLVRVMSWGNLDRRRVDWTYDALGRRVRQVRYVWTNSTWQVVEDLKLVSDPVWFGRHIAELNGTNGAVVRSYAWGLDVSESLDGAGGVGGLLWVRLTGGPAAGVHFVTYDGNGNVWNLVSASTGTETARYEYGPFGEPLRMTGAAAGLNPFRFSTKRTEDGTGLVLYEYRAYSPALGRWLSSDPIGEWSDRNLYGPVNNAPVDGHDLLGLTGCTVGLCNSTTRSTSDEAGWCGALKRLKDWCLGKLPPEEVFGPESPYTKEMSRSQIAEKLRRAFLEKNRNKPCPEWQAPTDAGLKFGPKEFICDLGNGTAQFVGSADGNVYIVGYRCTGTSGKIIVEYHLRNTTSLTSALYHCIPEGCNITAPGAPCSNYTNEYYWYEIYECSCCYRI
jgi:RHS repeat-associated protein